jgi:hypothetical protein
MAISEKNCQNMANLFHFSYKTSVAIARKLAPTKKADVIGEASKTPIKTMVFYQFRIWKLNLFQH